MITNIFRVRLNIKLIAIFLLVPLLTKAQFEEEEYDYNREFTWGINKNTNGGLIAGGMLKFSRHWKDNLFRTIGVEILNVKHPKEQRYVARQTGTSFTFGKQNFLYTIRGQYGFDRIMYKKAPQQGVQINLGIAAGPSIGIIAPYYILTDGQSQVYDPRRHLNPAQIQGSGKLFQGLGESKITPGLNARTGVSFEFGTFRRNVAGVEVGFAGEIFTRRVVLVPTQSNRSFYPSAYFTFFWGSRK